MPRTMTYSPICDEMAAMYLSLQEKHVQEPLPSSTRNNDISKKIYRCYFLRINFYFQCQCIQLSRKFQQSLEDRFYLIEKLKLSFISNYPMTFLFFNLLRHGKNIRYENFTVLISIKSLDNFF